MLAPQSCCGQGQHLPCGRGRHSVCSGLGSSAHLRGRGEGPDLPPSDLLKEGPRSILAFLAAGAVASRWMGKESVVAHTGHSCRRGGRAAVRPGVSRETQSPLLFPFPSILESVGLSTFSVTQSCNCTKYGPSITRLHPHPAPVLAWWNCCSPVSVQPWRPGQKACVPPPSGHRVGPFDRRCPF